MYPAVAESTYRSPFGTQPSLGQDWSSLLHGLLDVGGMIPGFGIVPDAINAGWYATEYALGGDPKDRTNMAYSASAMLPIGGILSPIKKHAGKLYNVFRGSAVKGGDEVMTHLNNVIGRTKGGDVNPARTSAWSTANFPTAEQYAYNRWMRPMWGGQKSMKDLRPIVQKFQVPEGYMLKHADFGSIDPSKAGKYFGDESLRFKKGIPLDYLKETIKFNPNLPKGVLRPGSYGGMPEILKAGKMGVDDPELYQQWMKQMQGDNTWSQILELFEGTSKFPMNWR